jgi:hypothetical protein
MRSAEHPRQTPLRIGDQVPSRKQGVQQLPVMGETHPMGTPPTAPKKTADAPTATCGIAETARSVPTGTELAGYTNVNKVLAHSVAMPLICRPAEEMDPQRIVVPVHGQDHALGTKTGTQLREAAEHVTKYHILLGAPALPQYAVGHLFARLVELTRKFSRAVAEGVALNDDAGT